MRWVVVGAGSAGCVVARRLHDAGHDVVLIESGPPLPPDAVPAEIDGDDSLAALGVPGRTHDDLMATRVAGTSPARYPRGRGVGGSSAVNAMIALRGDDELYRSWGWTDTDAAFDRILVPTCRPDDDELGRLDRLFLATEQRATVAELTRRDGRRVTTAEAYLWPIRNDDDFQIISETTIDRVVVDARMSVAGVVTASGAMIEADAVVVSAGAIESPAILLRSSLDVAGIGRGLADHPAVALTLQLRSGEHAHGLIGATLLDDDPIQMLALNHLGPGAASDLAVLLVALMRPIGRSGSVTLASSDPRRRPVVDFDLLSDPADVVALRRGVQRARAVLARSPMSDAIAAVFVDGAGTTLDQLDGDEAIDRWIRSHGADYVHASGSCADAIDVDGSVLGTEGLYVCDASAFPSIPNVNTHLPTMMLAERLTASWTDMGGSMP